MPRLRDLREYRITLTMTDLGRPEVAEGNAEAMLTGFEETHPEAGPAVGAHLEDGTLEVTFSVEAETANDAYHAGEPVFLDGATASGLEPSEVIHIHVEAVPVEELELQPA